LGENVPENLEGPLVGIEAADEVRGVVLEELLGVLCIDPHAGL